MLGSRRVDGSRFWRGRVAVGAASCPGPGLRRRWRTALGVGWGGGGGGGAGDRFVLRSVVLRNC